LGSRDFAMEKILPFDVPLADGIHVEARGGGIETDQSAGVGTDQQPTVVQRHQGTHVGIGQDGTAVGIGLLSEYLHAVAVVARQATEGADPDQSTAILHDRRGRGMRQSVGHAHRIEPRGFEHRPGVDVRRHLRGRGTGQQHAQQRDREGQWRAKTG